MSWRDACVTGLRSMHRRLGRVVLTMAAVALAAALLTALLIAVGAARTRVLSAVSKGGPLTGIEVFPNTADVAQLGSDSAKLGAARPIGDATVRRISRIGDVASVVPLTSTPVVVIPPQRRRSNNLPSSPARPRPFRDTLTGADVRDASRLPLTLLSGRLPGTRSLHEVVVTQAYLHLVGLRDADAEQVLGTELEIGAPRIFVATGGTSIRERWTRSTVVGVVAAEGVAGHLISSSAQVDASRAWSAASDVPSDRDLANFARDLVDPSPYSLLFVNSRGLDTVGAVRAAITRIGFSSSAPESLITSVDRYTQVVEIVLSAIGLIALGIAALGITNAMMAAVRERRTDIGVMKAIGAHDRDVRRIFLVEAGALGAVGGVVGTTLGYLIARIVGFAVNRYLSSQRLAGIHVGLPLAVVAIGIGGSTALALAAGTVPAQRAGAHPSAAGDGRIVSRRPRITVLLGWLLLGAMLWSGCGGGAETSTVPPESKGPATLYVALGGDDNGGGRNHLADAWPQVLFRTALPPTATFVNLSTPRTGAAEILTNEIQPALALRPDIVTITVLDDAERGTAPGLVESDLMRIVTELRVNRKTKIFIGTIPDGAAAPAATQALDQAITRVAAESAVTVVDLHAVTGSDDESTAAHIARSFAAALRVSR